MLFLPPASSRFVRLHGPYISEQESARLASFLRKQGKPTYDETITAEDKTGRRRSRVREGRSLRRGGAHRRLERPGVDLVPAAPAAHRLQPRRAARRHDGSGRARLGARRAARRARCSSRRTTSTKWTRSCGNAARRTASGWIMAITVEHRAAASWRRWRCACALAPARRRRRHAAGPREQYTPRARARARAARRRAAADAAADPRRSSRAYERVVRRYPTSGYSDNALWQAGNLSLLAFSGSARQPIGGRACGCSSS